MSAIVAVLMCAAIAAASPAAAATRTPVADADAVAVAARAEPATVWQWPVTGTVSRPFQQPAHTYGPGHRGIDIAVTVPGEVAVRTPAPGIVAYAGTVVDRPIVTIDHGDGLVTTLEPVVASRGVGEAVGAGEVVGTLGGGGHARAGELHLGVRLDGEYINPLRLLAEVPRAVLLPCCEPVVSAHGDPPLTREGVPDGR